MLKIDLETYSGPVFSPKFRARGLYMHDHNKKMLFCVSRANSNYNCLLQNEKA